MPNKTVITKLFAIADIVIGAASIFFFAVAPAFVPLLVSLPLFSTSFLISLALPAFILLAGIIELVRKFASPAVTFFVSFLAAVNSLAALLASAPPFFLQASAPPSLGTLFHYVLPAAAIAYFSAHSLASFLTARKIKDAAAPTPASTISLRQEMFCAQCRAPLRSSDEVCPGCGALISGWRCPACGFEGKNEEFVDNRCPRCGRGQKADPEKQ